jgi:hypothetical protein
LQSAAAAAIPNRQAPQRTYRIRTHLYNSLIEPSFAEYEFNFFNIVDRSNSVYLQLEGVDHFWLVLGVVNLFF